MKTSITAVVIAIVAVVISGFALSQLPKPLSQSFGATTAGGRLAENYDPYVMYNGGYNSAKDINTSAFLGTTGTFGLGSLGTAQVNEVVTTCNPIADTSIAATSTGYIYCTGITGVTSADYVIASFATSTTAIGTSWAIEGANASSTAGAVDIKIVNLTGTAATPSAAAGAQFASSTRLRIGH